MRIGMVRTDLDRLYLSDLENTSQRCFSSEPAGQSLNLHYPTTAQLKAVLDNYALLSIRGTDQNATVNTSSNNTLRIREVATASYTAIVVTTGATTAKTVIVSNLNTAFAAAGLRLSASIVGTNQIQINTVAPNSGPTARVQIDTVGNGSTLNTPLGLTDGAVAGLSVAALKTAVYPTASTINVASATIVALSTFTNLSTTQKASLVNGIADLVAPKLVETGPALLSFVYGVISKAASATFRPGGARIGLSAGSAVAVVANDGSTPFTL